MHALVLDATEEINQYNQCEGYEIGDVKLIFKNTHDDEENGKPKKFTINAKSSRAPDVFYFVHIDVDLDTIANCTCQEDKCECRNNKESDSAADATSQSETSENSQQTTSSGSETTDEEA